MRMPWKTCKVILRHIVAEIVQQQKRIVVAGIAKSKRSSQMNPRALQRRLRLDHLLNRTDRHDWPPKENGKPWGHSASPNLLKSEVNFISTGSFRDNLYCRRDSNRASYKR